MLHRRRPSELSPLRDPAPCPPYHGHYGYHHGYRGLRIYSTFIGCYLIRLARITSAKVMPGTTKLTIRPSPITPRPSPTIPTVRWAYNQRGCSGVLQGRLTTMAITDATRGDRRTTQRRHGLQIGPPAWDAKASYAQGPS